MQLINGNNLLHLSINRFNTDYICLLIQEVTEDGEQTIQSFQRVISSLVVCDDQVFVTSANLKNTIPLDILE
jgi:hypothetical protein